MIDWLGIFEEIKDTTTLSVLLTKQCNFRCDHCGYSAGPDEEKGYIQHDEIVKVRSMISTLNDVGISVRLNLVGGEPTLNLKEFERVFNAFSGWGYNYTIEMTTNGWWLKDDETAKEFMRIISENTTDYEDELSVRISSGVYHDYYQPPFLHGKANKEWRLQELWDCVFFERKLFCNDCGEEVDDLECPDCDNDNIECIYKEPDFNIPPNPEEEGWIFVSDTDDIRSLVPIGRGADCASSNTACKAGNNLSFYPDGTIADICCSFGGPKIGTLDDNPLVLLALARAYKKLRPNCCSCMGMAEKWRFKHYKRYLYRNLDRYIKHMGGLD
jgi:hypothetical protein